MTEETEAKRPSRQLRTTPSPNPIARATVPNIEKSIARTELRIMGFRSVGEKMRAEYEERLLAKMQRALKHAKAWA